MDRQQVEHKLEVEAQLQYIMCKAWFMQSFVSENQDSNLESDAIWEVPVLRKADNMGEVPGLCKADDI